MDCKTIFYASRRTSLCERALKKSSLELDLNLNDVSFASDKFALCSILTDAFQECNIVFVIGGLGFDDDRDIKNIVSRLIKGSCADECRKLKNDSGNDGYVIRAKRQLLILLPDEPEQIEAIMQGAIAGYIKITESAGV